MAVYPKPMEELIGLLSRLPGLGPRSATRIALFLLGQPKDLSQAIGKAMMEFKEKVVFCSSCYNISDQDPCPICTDPKRDRSTIMVLESPGDMFAVEEAGVYKGLYHILHGLISPLDKVGPEDLKVHELMDRIKREHVKEVIRDTNPTFQGEATLNYIMDVVEMDGLPVKVTRIAVGLPMGGDLKYIDKLTLGHAIRDRKTIHG
jgi:recombination protein RecR